MIRTRKSARPNRLHRLRPALDGLEDRALMSFAGSLDPTFGGGTGLLGEPINLNGTQTFGQFPNPVSVAIEPDGSIVTGVPDATANTVTFSNGGMSNLTFAVSHITTAGTLDTSFGTVGKADVPLPTGFAALGGPTALLVQSNGQIIVVGTVTNATQQNETLVARFNTDGTLDSSFGTNGVEVLDQATLGVSGLIFSYAALDPNGEIALAGTSDVLLLTRSGTPDPTFGQSGLAAIPQAGSNQVTNGLAAQPNSQIVVLTSLDTGVSEGSTIENSTTPVLTRFNTDGSIDTSLSQAGILASGIDAFVLNYFAGQLLENSAGSALIAEPDGQLLVLGGHDTTPYGAGPVPALAALNSDGSLAESTALLGISTGVAGFALEPDGDIVVSGSFATGTNPATIASYFSVLALTPALTPDTSFGVGGLSNIKVPGPYEPDSVQPIAFSPQAVAVTADNQVIVAGANPSRNEEVGIDFPPSGYIVTRLTATVTPATPGDFTGDGVSDIALYLPAYGEFAITDSSGLTAGKTVQFGIAGPGQTIPAPGDYYGTGQEDIAAYLPALGDYAIQDPTGKTAGIDIPFGIAGMGQTIPAPGDYYGTGADDIAVYLTQAGVFAILDPSGKTSGTFLQFGIGGAGQSIPVPGDYYGTGQDDIAVYLAQSGEWAILAPGNATGEVIPFGMPGIGNSIPVPGDYDGSGKTELAVYVPSLGELIYRPANGAPDVTIPFGTPGNGNTLPAPGDYDGSGKTEVAAYLPNIGVFAYRSASSGSDVYQAIGPSGPGQTIPVTTVVLSPFPGTDFVSTEAFEVASILGEPDTLDFLPSATAKKSRPGDPPVEA